MRKLPRSFSSTKEYMASFCDPLAEETHADLLSGISTLSQAPTREIFFVKQFVKLETPKDLFYHVTLESVRKFKDRGGRYEPLARDLIAITDVRPKCIADLESAFVLSVRQESCMTILSSKPILFAKDKNKRRETLYAVPLMNMNTNIRIWMALNSKLEGGKLNIIQNVLQYSSVVRTIAYFVWHIDIRLKYVLVGSNI